MMDPTICFNNISTRIHTNTQRRRLFIFRIDVYNFSAFSVSTLQDPILTGCFCEMTTWLPMIFRESLFLFRSGYSSVSFVWGIRVRVRVRVS